MGIFSVKSLGSHVQVVVIDEDPVNVDFASNKNIIGGDLVAWTGQVFSPEVEGLIDFVRWYVLDGTKNEVKPIIKRDTLDATTDPTVTDHELTGYTVGSEWLNTSTNKWFKHCGSGLWTPLN
jgi:hypothetical protein